MRKTKILLSILGALSKAFARSIHKDVSIDKDVHIHAGIVLHNF